MTLDNLAIEYRAELPTAQEFKRLFRSSGWTEALEVAADRLAATLPYAWYGICARRGGQIVGTRRAARPLHRLVGRPTGTVPSAGATCQVTPAESGLRS
jgi:hypothetical protein